MGSMKYSTARSEEADLQEEFASLVNEEIEKGHISITQLAYIMGVDRSAAFRALNGGRRLTYSEVVKISQRLGIKPEAWNSIGNPKENSGFLPLYGNVAASVWRVKGEKMPETLTPIRPINIGDGSTDDQFCYFVSEGLHVGEYAVCIHVDDAHELTDGDILIVTETRSFPPYNTEFSKTIMRVVQVADDNILLAATDDETGQDVIAYSSDGYELAGLVIGFYRQVDKKKP
jgi:hypothetical protein